MTTGDRQAHQHLVVMLLDGIEERRHRINVLQAHGVRSAGLGELTRELDELRAELATTVKLGS